MKIRKILHPTDLSDASDPAEAVAVSLAKRHGAELLLFHAVVTHENDLRGMGELLEDLLERLVTEGRAKLEERCSRLEKEHGVVARSHVEKHPSAYEAIRDRLRAFEPDLVVMGTHGRTGVERWFVGSVAEKVVRHSEVPVLTVRPEAKAGQLRRVLVPVDFSDASRRAVDAAAEVGGREVELTLLHVVLNPAFAGIHPGEYVRIFQMDSGLPTRIRERMTEWAPERTFEAEVREADDVAEDILRVAVERSVDLIAVGSRGLTGLDYFLLGSVAEKILRGSPVPVLVVK